MHTRFEHALFAYRLIGFRAATIRDCAADPIRKFCYIVHCRFMSIKRNCAKYETRNERRTKPNGRVRPTNAGMRREARQTAEEARAPSINRRSVPGARIDAISLCYQ